MSADNPAPPGNNLQAYLEAWGSSIGHVLQEIAGTPYSFQNLSAEATQNLLASSPEDRIGAQFEVAQHLAGRQGFILARKDAVRLAQLLLGEPEDDSAALDDDHRDAVSELFRQFAGTAATALKTLADGEVSLKWVSLEALAADSAVQAGMEWSNSGRAPLNLVLQLDSTLVSALSPVAAPAVELPVPAPQAPPAAPARDPKLDLLMDVELDVTLRFGEREMALRDILDLSAGSVVELNQYVQDPVELLVGKKMIARGEVVVLDGNYALRVMEIISPIERIESLKPVQPNARLAPQAEQPSLGAWQG